LNIFKTISNIVAKSLTTQDPTERMPRTALVNFLLGRHSFDLAASVAVSLYNKCSPLSDGVDRVVNAAKDVKIVLNDELSKKFIAKHPVLDLLHNPSIGVSYKKFMEQLLKFLIVTGDAYVMVNSAGGINSVPSVLRVIPPQSVTLLQGVDGFVDRYDVYFANTIIMYNRALGRYAAKIDGVTSELIHFSVVNLLDSFFNLKGYSIFNSLFYEIEQYCASNVHNLSVLKRGMTLGGILFFDSVLSKEAMDKIKSSIDEYYSGEANAGKILALDNAMNTRYVQTYAVTKDMDFEKLAKRLTVAIYNKLKIPQPKVNSETMTMANLDIAQEAFYDDAVFPWLNDILSSMTLFLTPRYPDLQNLTLSYDRNTIPALESRNIEILVSKNKLNALTKNELREALGYNQISDEGVNTLYQEANLIPITQSLENDDTSQQ